MVLKKHGVTSSEHSLEERHFFALQIFPEPEQAAELEDGAGLWVYRLLIPRPGFSTKEAHVVIMASKLRESGTRGYRRKEKREILRVYKKYLLPNSETRESRRTRWHSKVGGLRLPYRMFFLYLHKANAACACHENLTSYLYFQNLTVGWIPVEFCSIICEHVQLVLCGTRFRQHVHWILVAMALLFIQVSTLRISYV